jgi:hypothetical protein
MSKAKQQPDNDQISVDPKDPDVRAFAAAGSSEDAHQCPIGTHWNGSACVADDLEQPQQQ